MRDPSTYNEPDLLLRIADGDEKAFTDLYRLYTPRLKAYAWKFTQSVEDTEEIIQESFTYQDYQLSLLMPGLTKKVSLFSSPPSRF